MYGDGQITSEELALKFAEVGREEHAAELAAVNASREQANLGGVVDETTRKSDLLAESMIGVTEETGNVGEEAIYTRDDMGQLQEGLVGTHDAFDETVKRASRLREALARLRAMAQRTKSALDNVNDAMGDGGDRGRREAGGRDRGGRDDAVRGGWP
jgi:hypothetical protein